MAVLRLNCQTCRQCLLRFGVGNEYFNDPVKYVSFSVYNIIFCYKVPAISGNYGTEISK